MFSTLFSRLQRASGSALQPCSQRDLLRDLSAGFAQQMYLWGLDVEHDQGNLLEQSGFERRPSPGLTGTSCYSLPWEQGHIELHGSQAGYQLSSGGVYFVRPLKGCFEWPKASTPVPGIWRELVAVRPVEAVEKLSPLIRWWLHQEDFVLSRCGLNWREQGIQRYLALPNKKRWLDSQAATRWLSSLLEDPARCPHAGSFA